MTPPGLPHAAETHSSETQTRRERRRQLRGLLWLAFFIAVASLLRVVFRGELHHLILTPRWWRAW